MIFRVTALALFLATAPVSAAEPDLTAAWADLLSPDEAKATRAALAFAAKPAESVAFLKARVRPVKRDQAVFAKLVADLSDADPKVREAAQQDLSYYGKFIKGDLEKAQAEAADEESRDRLKRLLDRIAAEEKEKNPPKENPNPLNPNGGVSVEVTVINGVRTVTINGQPLDTTPRVVKPLPPLAVWVRASRAIGVLEFLGTPDAVAVLEALSVGEDTAPPTVQAQDALARLKRKK
jgi:hypothetical protein